MAQTETEGFEVRREDGFSRITLDNPPRNLLDPRIMAALRATIVDADADDSVSAIVLTGSGDIFCGGLDIAQIQAGANPVDFAAGLVELLRVLPGLGKPFIAAVNGDALASGYSLACAADIAIAVEGAKLGTLEATVGIWPMIAQVPALQRLQVRHAIENILTGEPFDAARAQEIGVVNRVVPAASLWDEVRRWVEMSTRAGTALPAGRRAFYRFVDMSYDDALTASLDEFRRMFEGG
jgi:enoyl-CoA hydratase/carnithine racemase